MSVEQAPDLVPDDERLPVGRLVSLNVGLPKDVPWHGRTVHTGVWKDPVDGPRMVRTTNIDGDGQGDLGGHGGPHRAVFVYQLASYQHWREEFGRDDLEYGQFGENFTVDGLPDDEVCVGDRYAIGEAQFEVTQPRVTCFRLGMRMAEPRMPALVVAHHRPGFYLRVLEEGEIERLGTAKPTHVDVRVIVATHRHLEALVQNGKFRQDLFHRIFVFPIVLPPLRDRQEDLPALVGHFASQVCAQNGWKPVTFTAEAVKALQQYPWPGNVRELRNMLERLMLLAPSDEVDVDTVQSVLAPGASSATAHAGSGSLASRVEDFEREVILSELRRANYHITNAAKALGLERSHLYKKAEQLGIDIRQKRRAEETLD